MALQVVVFQDWYHLASQVGSWNIQASDRDHGNIGEKGAITHCLCSTVPGFEQHPNREMELKFNAWTIHPSRHWVYIIERMRCVFRANIKLFILNTLDIYL